MCVIWDEMGNLELFCWENSGGPTNRADGEQREDIILFPVHWATTLGSQCTLEKTHHVSWAGNILFTGKTFRNLISPQGL